MKSGGQHLEASNDRSQHNKLDQAPKNQPPRGIDRAAVATEAPTRCYSNAEVDFKQEHRNGKHR